MVTKEQLKVGDIIMREPTNKQEELIESMNDNNIGCVYKVTEIGVNFFGLSMVFDDSQKTEYFSPYGENKNYGQFTSFEKDDVIIEMNSNMLGKIIEFTPEPDKVAIVTRDGSDFIVNIKTLRKVFDEKALKILGVAKKESIPEENKTVKIEKKVHAVQDNVKTNTTTIQTNSVVKPKQEPNKPVFYIDSMNGSSIWVNQELINAFGKKSILSMAINPINAKLVKNKEALKGLISSDDYTAISKIADENMKLNKLIQDLAKEQDVILKEICTALYNDPNQISFNAEDVVEKALGISVK